MCPVHSVIRPVFLAAVVLSANAWAEESAPPPNMPRVAPVLEDLTAAWTWPHRPTAIRHVGKEDKTYFGFVTNAGHAYIASYDHNRNEYEATFLRDHRSSSDHAQTIIHVRPDGRIIAFVCAHTDDTFRWFISKEPEDISEFGPERSLTNRSPRGSYSYPQPVYLADEGRIYLFCRRRAMEGELGGRVWGVSISEDDGETFVHQPFPLLARKDASSPYTIMKGNGKDTIHFARSDWMAGQISFVRKDIYAFYYRGGAFYRYDGTKIRTWDELPLEEPAELDLVYQTEPDGNYAFIRDIALIDGERPALVFTTLEREGHDESQRMYHGSGRNWYKYVEWDGQRWTEPEVIVEAGGNRTDDVPPHTTQPAYDGMIMLNHENPREVVLGREVPPLHSKRFVIEIWSRQEDGTWRKKHDVSKLDPQQPEKVFKAYIPWNHHPEFKVLWLGGPYSGITKWETRMFRTVGAFPE